MAANPVSLGEIVVPRVFAPYTQILTEEKSRLVQSGALARDGQMDALLVGGGNTFDIPRWGDLDNDAENVDDAETTSGGGGLTDSTPNNIDSLTEVAARLKRNNSWASYDLLANLAGSDPLEAISSRVAAYWARRLQALFIACQSGVNKDNGANDSGDYAFEIVGGSFTDGVTNFSAEAYIDAQQTMGDSSEDLAMLMVHSVVYARMKKNNLIDFIPDARGEVQIATFQGAEVIQDDGMPSSTAVVRADGSAGVAGMYESWLFGPGQMRLGVGTPRVPAEVDRKPEAASGGGLETLHSRIEWMMHPNGHAYTGAATKGGPTNATINSAASWDRVFPERKQVKFARLITRES